MIDEREILNLKRNAEEARARVERAKGALAQLRERLKDEFGFSSASEAEEACKELEEEVRSLSSELEEMIEKYRQAYGRLD